MEDDRYLHVSAVINIDVSKFELSPEFATKKEEIMDIIGKPMPNAENPEAVYEFLKTSPDKNKYIFPTGENGPLPMRIIRNVSTNKYAICFFGCLKNCYMQEDVQEMIDWFKTCVEIIGSSAIDHACISVTDNRFWTKMTSTTHKQNKEPCLYSDDKFVWISTSMM